MKGNNTPHDYYNELLSSDEVINELSEESSYIRFAGKFATKQRELKRQENYTEFFNNYQTNNP